jgi:iduronate 2-sulfatase
MRQLLPFLAVTLCAVERPNVVLICVDDLKPTIGCFGDSAAKTPHMDRLARQGVVFTRAYVQQAVCAPSRHSLLTGLRPDQLGIYDLATPFRLAAPDAVTLPQAFMRAGWQAEAIGKIYHQGNGNGNDQASWSIPHIDFKDDTPLDHPGGPGMPVGAVTAKRPEGWTDRGAPWAWPECGDEVTKDGRTAAHAVQRLGALAEAGKPFFLAVGFSKPHLPFRVPKRYWDLHDPARLPVEPVDAAAPIGAPTWGGHRFGELRGYSDIQGTGPLTEAQARVMVHGYYAATSFTDAQIGTVLDELERRDLMQTTIVVLWGDHGWHLGDHGWWCKHTNYEQATRNPVIVCAPGLTRGATSASLIGTIDLYPTLCALAGVEAPAGLPGHSLVPVLRDPATTVQDAVLSVYPRTPAGREILGRALRSERWRYVAWHAFDNGAVVAEELYDLASDPRESRSLASDPAQQAVMDDFRRRLAALPAPKPQLGSPQAVGK